MKSIFTHLRRSCLILLSCVGFMASAQTGQQDRLYAFMTNADSWSEGMNTIPYYGFYSFNANGQGGFRAESPTGPAYIWALNTNSGGGGVYADGYYYCYTVSGLYYNYRLSFFKVDVKTWTNATSGSVSGSTENPLFIPSDLAADPVSGRVFAACRPKYGNSDYGVLCEVNKETGILTRLANTQYYKAIACDATGQLYGLAPNANLYKVGLDGTSELVGPTGLAMSDNEVSATIDFRSGKMYLNHFGREIVGGVINYNAHAKGLYEIDLNTGAATCLFNYPGNETLTALSILNAHPSAPDNVYDLSVQPSPTGELKGTVTFTVPSRTYGQAALTGNVKAEIYVDNTLASTLSLTPGQKAANEVNVTSDGNHTVALVLTSASGHEGVRTSATGYFGPDAPDAISNLHLTTSSADNRATLTWDAPTGSLHGGIVNPDDIRYTIVRYPGAVTVQRACKETSFSEVIDQEYCRTFYKVTPYMAQDPNLKGATSTSNKEFLGHPWEMPFLEMFVDEASMDAYTIIDANGDGGNWEWEDPVWKWDPIYGCAFFYHFIQAGPADDWLITPKLDLDAEKLYKLTFQLYGYYSGGAHHMRVLTGNTPTVEGMHQVLYDKTEVSDMDHVLTISSRFAPMDGDLFIGFHNLTESPQHVSIDNIYVEEVGSSRVPGKVEALTGEITDRTNHYSRLSFSAPRVDAAGRPLSAPVKIAIYRGEEKIPLTVMEDVQPGTKITYDDNNASPVVNIYTVRASNSYGTGIEDTVTVDMRAGRPQPVKNVRASLVAPSQALITWEAPTEVLDENGNEIDTSCLRYLVYRPMGDGDNDYEIIARDIAETQFVDNNPSARYGDVQGAALYYVSCVNGDDESYATPSNLIYTGQPYKLPFAETWKEMATSTSPWLKDLNGSANWVVAHQGYAPDVAGQDGFGLMSFDIVPGCDYGTGALWSPRIDLSDVKDAKLEFYLYGENTYKTSDAMSIYVDIEGQGTQKVDGATFFPRTFAGWKKCTVDLTPYVGNDRISIVFYGYIMPQGDERRMHIDNMSVTGTVAPLEIKIKNFTGPTDLREGKEYTYTLVVENVGTRDQNACPVQLTADGSLWATAQVPALSAGDQAEIEVKLTPEQGSASSMELVAYISPKQGEDAVAANNSMALRVNCLPLNLPYVTDLTASYDSQNQKALLSWGNPREAEYVETIVDGAEHYDAFAIEGFGCWSLHDGDGMPPFRFQDPVSGQLLFWDNFDLPQAWMVFNPSDVTSENSFQPMTGKQAFVSFAAAGRQNDDWLISPELSGEAQLLSFYARRLNKRDDNEQYNILYSTTDANIESFKRINGEVPLLADEEWTLYHIALPEGTKYFAIQYVGKNQSAMMIDDIQFEAYPTHRRPDGYAIYRDGQRLNTTLTGRKNYTDTEVTPGRYEYEVRPVFDGVEAPSGNKFILDTAGLGSIGMEGGISVFTTSGYLHVRGAHGKQVSTFTVAGKLRSTYTASSDSEMYPLPAGIYLVKADTRSFKVIVR